MNNKSYTRILSAVTVGVLIGLGHIPAGMAKLTQATLSFTPGEGSKPVVQSQTGEVKIGERFITDANEVREVLLTDGTVLTLGPNSHVVVENYEYDREDRVGHLELRIESGFVRVVGGVLNNTRSIQINTPAAGLTLDNAAATVAVTAGRTRVSLLYGKSLSMTSGGKTETLVKPGFELVSVEKSSTPDGPSMQDGEVILADMAALETVQLEGKGNGQTSSTDANSESALETDVNAVVTEDQPAGQLANNNNSTLTPINIPPPPVTQTATLGLGDKLTTLPPAQFSPDIPLGAELPDTITDGPIIFELGFDEKRGTFRRFQTDTELEQSASARTNDNSAAPDKSNVLGQSIYLLKRPGGGSNANPALQVYSFSNGFAALVLDRVDQNFINEMFSTARDSIFIADKGLNLQGLATFRFENEISALVEFVNLNGNIIDDLFDLDKEKIEKFVIYKRDVGGNLLLDGSGNRIPFTQKDIVGEAPNEIEIETNLPIGHIIVNRSYTGKQKPVDISGKSAFANGIGDVTDVSGLGFFPGYRLDIELSTSNRPASPFSFRSSKIVVRDISTGDIVDSGVIWNDPRFSSGGPEFTPPALVPEKLASGAFYAFDFKPTNGFAKNAGERFFVYGGAAPADNLNGRLPGTGGASSDIQAFRYDVRDGLTPDSTTAGFIPGSALRRDATLGRDTQLGYINNAYDSGLVLASTNQSGAENAFLKVDFALDGERDAQRSSISVATGTVGATNAIGLSGGMVGSVQLDAGSTATQLRSGVYSQPADGAGWFGGNQYSDGSASLDGKIGYIVLGSDDPGTAEIEFASEQVLGRSNAVEYEYLRLASRGVNNSDGSVPLAVVPTSRSSQTLSAGYAAALVQSVDGGTVALYALKSSADGSGVNLETNEDTNRVTSRLSLAGESIDATPTAPTSKLDIAFGGDSNAELSAYIGDKLFAARSSSATFDGSNAAGGEAALVAGAALREGLPKSMRSKIPDYKYVKWGFFFGDFKVTGNRRDSVNLGSWVAAEKIPDVGELRMQGTATHVGHVVGNVFSGVSTYTAVGSYQNVWNFDQRAGVVTMNFDDSDYTGTTQLNVAAGSSGVATFKGSLAAIGRTGTLDGALVGVRTDLHLNHIHPQGEIGQFSIQENPGSNLYRATGTFAAENK